ncbi:MAG: methyltransferase domain-containing protein [Candidatus Aenigmarchaeota archaeon]|nr:methyltransferase domain-containing protein [Candidatus Aenigmarchaeota archaeon]
MGSEERFGYEWNKYRDIIPEYEDQFKKWIFPLDKKSFNDKIVLDAGCGTGRNSHWPLIYKAKKVVAFDYDKRTVEVAKKNLNNFKNAEVLYKSIYDIDFKNKFDIVFSIGVIHHLEYPHKAVENLAKSVKKGGVVLIWVYGYEGNEWIVNYISPLRKITSRLPLKLTNLVAYLFSVPFFTFVKVIPQKKPYFKQLSNFRFWHTHSIIFDQLIPRIANYWTKKEAMDLFKNKGLEDIKAYRVNKNSWTVIGKKSK